MYFSLVCSYIAAFDILFGIKHDIIAKIGSLPLGFLGKHTSGSIKKIITEDVDRIELFIAHHLADTISGMVLPIIAVLYMFTIDWRIAIIALIPVPLAIYSMNRAFKESDTRSMKKYYDALERMNGTIVEYVRGMPVVKVFTREKTVIVIAHRLNTIQDADRIVVIEGGRVAQTGKHDELIRSEGIYQRMWNEQQKAAKWTVSAQKKVQVNAT